MAWNSEFRIEGVPEDKRHASMGDAEALRRRVRRMTPGRPLGKKERGKKPCGITLNRVNHSQGRALERFLKSLGGDNWSEREKLLLMDSRPHGGFEVLATWRQERVEGWVEVGSWKVFQGDFTDAETGEEFDHKGRYIFKKVGGVWVTVDWALELSASEREMFLPKSHPLHPKFGKGKVKTLGRIKPGNRIVAPVANTEIALAMFSKSLVKGRIASAKVKR